MKKAVVLALVLIVAHPAFVCAADIADTSWNESNIQALRGYDKAQLRGSLTI